MEYAGKKTKELELFQSIDDMWLYNFDQYRKTNDNNWFIKGYDGRQTKVDSATIRPTELRINDEYYRETDDRAFQTMIQRLAKINLLQSKYVIVYDLTERMIMGFGASEQQQNTRYLYIQQIKSHGYKMQFIADPIEDLESVSIIRSQLQGIKTKIAILKDELQKEGNSQSMSLQKQLLIMESALNLHREINPKKTTIKQWIEMGKLMTEKSKQN